MGVNCTTYLVYGVKLPYSVMEDFHINDNEDLYLPYIEGRPGVTYSLIIDGMNGEYCVFGKILAKKESYEDDDFTFIDSDFLFATYGKSFWAEFEKLFPFYFERSIKLQLMMFNDFS